MYQRRVLQKVLGKVKLDVPSHEPRWRKSLQVLRLLKGLPIQRKLQAPRQNPPSKVNKHHFCYVDYKQFLTLLCILRIHKISEFKTLRLRKAKKRVARKRKTIDEQNEISVIGSDALEEQAEVDLAYGDPQKIDVQITTTLGNLLIDTRDGSYTTRPMKRARRARTASPTK